MKNTLTKISISLALSLAFSTAAFAHSVEKEGYLIDTRGNVVKNNYNECWRTGYWTPAMAIAECDPDLVKKEEPKAEAAPAAAPVASGPRRLLSQKSPCKPKPCSISTRPWYARMARRSWTKKSLPK